MAPRYLSTMSGKGMVTEVSIEAASVSEPFDFPGIRAFAVFGPTGTSRTVTLQVRSVDGTSWTNTALTATTSVSNNVLWNSDDLAPYTGGLAGNGPNMRFSLSGSDTLEVKIYGNRE